MLGCAYTGNHILALCVDEVFAVEDVFAGSGVAGEGYTGSRRVAHVAEYHGLYVHGRTPLFGDLVHAAVEDGAFVHPAIEYGADGTPQLLPGRGGEVFAGVLLDSGFEEANQLFEVFDLQLGVALDAFGLFHLVHHLFEGVDVFFGLGFHAQYHVAIHLYETTVRVPSETGIARFLGDGFYGLVVHTQVEHGIHHTRHGDAGTRTNRYQQRVGGVAELRAGEAFDVGDGLLYVVLDLLNDGFTPLLCICCTNLGGDGESRGYRNTDEIHLCQVGAFASQQVFHVGTAFCFTVAKSINSFHR